MDTFARDYGTDSFESPGVAYVFMGVIVAGLGIAALFAGRQIALAIVTVVMTAVALFVSLIGVAVVDDQQKFDERFAAEPGSAGIGVVLGIVSMLVALAGSIVVLAKRRRPAT